MLCSLLRRCAATFVHFSLLAIAFATVPLANADTLASWNLGGIRASTYAYFDATSCSNCFASANLALGSGVSGADYANSFAGCKYTKDGTEITAENNNEFLEVHFVVGLKQSVSLSSLDYSLRRVDKGPNSFKWLCLTNNVIASLHCSSETLTQTYSASSPANRTLSLTDIPELPAGTDVSLRLVSWGATSAAKDAYFGFTGTITLSGTAIAAGGGEGQGEDDGELSVSTAVGAISVYAGEPKTISFTATGLGDAAASTNLYLVANGVESAVGGFASVENGVITISPTKADVGEKILRLKVSINDGEANEASAFADIAISVAVRSPAVSVDNASVTAYVGSPTTMSFSFTDDVGTLTTNVVCNAEVSNESWSYTDGVLTYTPAAGDVALSPVSFTVSITGTDNCDDSVNESATVTVTVEEPLETLVTWNLLSANAGTSSYDVSNGVQIANSTLGIGPGCGTNNASGTWQAKSFSTTGQSFELAKTEGEYLEVTFTAAQNYDISPKLLEYNLKRSSTGPSLAQWVWVDVDNSLIPLDGQINLGTATETNALAVSLSPIGEVEKGGKVTLRLYAWGASGSSGTFGFNKSGMVLYGRGKLDEDAYVMPAVEVLSGAIGDCYVGETNIVAFSFMGDSGPRVTGVWTNVSTEAGVNITGYTNFVGNTFVYVPSEADAALGLVAFTITLGATDREMGESTAIATFSVSIWEKPTFFETFDNANKSGYAAGNVSNGDMGTWYGTNCLVGSTASDTIVAGKGIRFQKGAGCLEMTTAKNCGAGFVALSHGLYGTQTGTATITLKISQKSGKVWGDWEDIGTIRVGEELTRTCFTRLEYEGFVKLRIEYVSEANFNIDDVAIGDYGDPVEDPQEDATILPIVNSSMYSQNFNGIGNTATATLPNGWRMVATNALDCHDLKWDDGQSTTTKRGGFGMSTSANSGFYNFTNGNENAVGFLSSGSSFKSCALMVHLKNTGPDAIGLLDVSYNVEQWRRGYGKRIALYISRDGETWTQAGARFVTTTETNYAEGSETEVVYTGYAAGDLPAAISVSGRIRLPSEEKLAAGESLWLAWHYTRLEGNTSDDGSKAQALAIDDVKIAAGDIKMTTFVVQ
ncbi:MAG: hypothetical protein IKO40_04515 [Kiritimatiellae bacterium]|nr:hypothetical protein [Kiritimatiellia bacterium]